MKQLSLDIDLDHEVRYLAQFVAQKWTPIKGLENMFRDIRDAACKAGRAWTDSHKLALCAYDQRSAREEQLKAVLSTDGARDVVRYYDSVCQFFDQVSRLDPRIHHAALGLDGPWDFQARTALITRQLLAKYPDLVSTKPHGWADLASGYGDFDGQDEYDHKADRALFEGALVESIVSGDFVHRIALPNVMYDQKCRGRRAGTSLIGAAFAHFLTIQQWLNTHRATAALKAIATQAPEQLLFSTYPKVTNPHLKAMLALMAPLPPEADYAAALTQRKGWDALSEEEKTARRAANSAQFAAAVASLKSSCTPDDGTKRREGEAQALRVMREVFAG